MTRSALAAVGLLLAAVGFPTFAAIGVGVWVVKQEADATAAALAARADDGIAAADRAVGLVREVVARSEADLAAARAAPAAAAGPAPDLVTRMAVQQATRRLPGGIEQARDAVGTASDAVVVADAALGVLLRVPAGATPFALDPGQLRATQAQLNEAAGDLRSARRVLGVPLPVPDGPASPEQLSAVGEGLTRVKGYADEMDRGLAQARQRVAEGRRLAGVWGWRAAVAATALSALAALGQVFMARACWRTLRRQGVAAG